MTRIATNTLLILGFLLLAACRTAPVYNVESAAFGAPDGLTMKQAEAAIIRGGAARGWQMRTVSPGRLVGTLKIRAHTAIVDIAYDTKTFSITYKDSQNLKYDGTNIHSNYNGWVTNLANSIQAQVPLV